jgi:transcriptional regulator with XRE-family HTH domain
VNAWHPDGPDPETRNPSNKLTHGSIHINNRSITLKSWIFTSALRKTTFEKLAVEIGKDKAHLSRIMAGKKKANLDLVQKIADELGVDVQTLFKP